MFAHRMMCSQLISIASCALMVWCACGGRGAYAAAVPVAGSGAVDGHRANWVVSRFFKPWRWCGRADVIIDSPDADRVARGCSVRLDGNRMTPAGTTLSGGLPMDMFMNNDEGTVVVAAGPFLHDSLPTDVYRLIMDQLPASDIANLALVDSTFAKLVRAEYHPWNAHDIDELDAKCHGEAIRRQVLRALAGHRADEAKSNEPEPIWLDILKFKTYFEIRECLDKIQQLYARFPVIRGKSTAHQVPVGIGEIQNLDGIEQLFTENTADTTDIGFSIHMMVLHEQNMGPLWRVLSDRKNALKWLHIHGKMEPEDMRALAEVLKVNQRLSTLKFHRNQIGDEAASVLAEALKENQHLANLDLSWNQFGDEGARALADALLMNRGLASLDISFNQIGEDGACALAEMLKVNHNLIHLNIVHNEIGRSGARALAEALKENKGLTHLNLESNQIGNGGACALAETVTGNREISF